jgi:hypothetical protein
VRNPKNLLLYWRGHAKIQGDKAKPEMNNLSIWIESENDMKHINTIVDI